MSKTNEDVFKQNIATLKGADLVKYIFYIIANKKGCLSGEGFVKWLKKEATL